MDLTDCLFQWFKTFDLKNNNCENPKDLCDGVAITHALVQIAPEFFSNDLLKKIENNCGNNWFLRLSNLRCIYLCIIDYYNEILDRTLPDKLQPDLEKIARDYNMLNLGKLLQLILGCAINCMNKEKHIEIMTTLSLQVKQALKIAIDELENFDDMITSSSTTTTSNINQSLQSLTTTNNDNLKEINQLKEEIKLLNEIKENALQRCSDLELNIIKLEDEKRMIKLENEKLLKSSSSKSSTITKNKTNLLINNTNTFDSIENENLFQRLNTQLNTLQLELTNVEEQKDDLKIQLELKENEIQKLLLQNDQLQIKLNEFKYDRDELDRLKYLNEEIIKFKNINDIQKKKLEEYSELKKQMKLLEERNTKLIKQIYELEEENKSINVYKNQLELIKKQRDELRNKINEEIFRADKNEDEIKRLNKKYNDLLLENDKFKLEIDQYKQEYLQLKHNNNNNNNVNNNNVVQSIDIINDNISLINNNQNNNNDIKLTNNNNNNLNDNLNEKLIRLELENNRLKNDLKNLNDERIRLLESQLEDEKNMVTKLEQKNRKDLQKIIKLEGQLNDLTSMTDNNENFKQLKLKLNELQIENNNLKLILDKKDVELNEHEERFRKHLNKAKETYGILETHIINNSKLSSTITKDSQSLPIDNLNNNNNNVDYWKNLCNEKDLQLDKLRQEFEQTNAFRDIEERLMSVSFHTMAFNLQRRSAEDRVYSNTNTNISSNNNFPTTNTTFLQRQREASSRKFIIPPSDLVE